MKYDIYIYILIAILIGIVIIYSAFVCNKFKNLKIRIEEVESNIDSLLNARFNLLLSSIEIIKNISNLNKDVLNCVQELKKKKLNHFELDAKLYECIESFNNYKLNYPELMNEEDFIKLNLKLSQSEAELHAYKKYYNDRAGELNELLSKTPTNIIGKISKYKKLVPYDHKKIHDNKTGEFKI